MMETLNLKMKRINSFSMIELIGLMNWGSQEFQDYVSDVMLKDNYVPKVSTYYEFNAAGLRPEDIELVKISIDYNYFRILESLNLVNGDESIPMTFKLELDGNLYDIDINWLTMPYIQAISYNK